MANLAPTVFESGASDRVSLVDVYAAVDDGVRNNLTSKLSAFANDLSSVFQINNLNLKGITDGLRKSVMDPATAKRRLTDSLQSAKGEINNLSTTTYNSIINELANSGKFPNTNGLYRDVNIAVGNSTVSVYNEDSKGVKATLELISDVTKNPVFEAFDVGAEIALVTGIIGTVNEWGIPELVDSLLEDKDDSYKHTVLSRSSSYMADTSNLDMLAHYVDKGMIHSLTTNTPDFGLRFIQSFNFPATATPADYPNLHVKFVKVMNALIPNWLIADRGFTYTTTGGVTTKQPRTVTNLAVINRASPDAIKLLISNNTTITPAMIAKHYGSTEIKSLAKTLYPQIALR